MKSSTLFKTVCFLVSLSLHALLLLWMAHMKSSIHIYNYGERDLPSVHISPDKLQFSPSILKRILQGGSHESQDSIGIQGELDDQRDDSMDAAVYTETEPESSGNKEQSLPPYVQDFSLPLVYPQKNSSIMKPEFSLKPQGAFREKLLEEIARDLRNAGSPRYPSLKGRSSSADLWRDSSRRLPPVISSRPQIAGPTGNLSPWGDAAIRKIHDNWRYPSEGPEKGDISIRIVVVVEKKGKIISAAVLDSSGNSPFALSAMNAIEKSSPFPPLPQDYSGENLEFIVNFRYEHK